MNKNDGGPAFPIPLNKGELFDGLGPADGMSLRDWFAGKVLEGFMSRKETHQFLGDSVIIAGSCYVFADAMLAEREKDNA